MKNDDFLVIQDFKKKVLGWRIVTLFCLISVILISAKNLFSSGKIGPEKGYIARVTIRDAITIDSFSNKKLKELEEKKVIGVIVDIDSPGGEVLASERLYLFFRNLAKNKPVVSVINSYGTSGAYMVAMASDYIIAGNTSLVGSIGVILQTEEVTELADKLGVKFMNFKSSPLKASPNIFEKITPDVEMVTNQLIEDVYDYFLGIFIERRKIKAIEAQEIANGQVYTGRQALEFGLIDKIGGEDKAVEYLKDNNIDMDKVDIVDFDISGGSDGFLFSIKKKLFGSIANRLFGNKTNIMAIYR